MEHDYLSDLDIAFKAITKNRMEARKYYRYYEGDQPMVFTYDKLVQIFGRSGLKFIQNWCAVVIDSVCDRLVFRGWDLAKGDREFREASLPLLQSSISNLAYEVHLDALVTGNGYIVLDIADDDSIVGYRNRPEQMAVIYEEEDPTRMAFAAKMWRDASDTFLNLYYEDEIVKFNGPFGLETASGFNKDYEVGANPFDKIPVVHFMTRAKELANIIPLQDAVNKTFSDMMVVGEFNAFPQRWAVTQADVSNLKSDPQSILKFPKGASDEENTQIGEFGAASTKGYLETIESLASVISVISRTPKYYFLPTGASISGDALIVMEAPLVKKVERYIEAFTEPWLRYLSFYSSDWKNATPIWGRVGTEQINSEATAFQTLVAAGLPLVTVARRFGWNEKEIDQMRRDIAEQKKENADLAAQALEIAKLRMEQNNEPEI